jgi:hypothetical protein
VKIIVLFTLATTLLGAAFAQKTQDPELRNKRATAVNVQPHKYRPAATRPATAGSSSAHDLAKIEQNSVSKINPRHKARPASPAAHPAVQIAQVAPDKNKPVKFSYHPPQGSKTAANAAPATTSAPPVKVQH